MLPHFGKSLFLLGLILMLLGCCCGWAGGNLLGWFGRLPGDVRVERPGVRFYAPLASGLLVSVLLSLFLWLVRRLGE